VPFRTPTATPEKAVTTEANDDTDSSEVIRVMFPQSERITFREVGGLHDVKKQIQRKIITPFQKPSLFERFRKKAGGGILLYGPPGCGKTLLARATAGECGASFYNVAISDVLDMYIGESERKLHAIFDQARHTAPAVLFFDEVEALGGKRQYTREATSSKLVSQFLSELDGFAQNNQGVLILAATNVPWAVDAAFRRPGRFDRVLFVPPPDHDARAAILQLLLAGRPVEGGIDNARLAKRSSGFSGADLRNLVETAVDEAIEESITAALEVPLKMSHLDLALQQVRPTTVEWLTTARNYARYSNEAGQYDDVLAFLGKHGNE
jgi:SpoVK/Ycf46/Vps4 family AAA+-type ATPase